jgi:hypothetical protein
MRRISTPWFAENVPGGFVVRDANRKPVAYVYGHDGVQQIKGHPSLLTMDQAREMALLIVRLSNVGRDKARHSNDQHPPPSAGKVAKRSRFDTLLPSHSIPAPPPIPVLNGRAKATVGPALNGGKKEGGEDHRSLRGE